MGCTCCYYLVEATAIKIYKTKEAVSCSSTLCVVLILELVLSRANRTEQKTEKNKKNVANKKTKQERKKQEEEEKKKGKRDSDHNNHK